MFSIDGRLEPGGRPASVYERVLGEEFASLEPQLRQYFGRIPLGFEGVGVGLYDEAGLRRRVLRPLFALLGRWHIAFAEHGEDVPFTVRNTVGSDGVLCASRTFGFRNAVREMNDAMRVVDGRLVDRIGTNGAVEVDLDLCVSDGQLVMTSRRLSLRVFGLRLRLPPIAGVVLRERTASPEDRTQHVEMRMSVPLLGRIYGYSGTFTYQLQPIRLSRGVP